jgi:hypothetical protein
MSDDAATIIESDRGAQLQLEIRPSKMRLAWEAQGLKSNWTKVTRAFAVNPAERTVAESKGRDLADFVVSRELARIEARKAPGPTLNRPIPASTRAVPSHAPTKAKPTSKPTTKATPAPSKAPAPRAIPKPATSKPAGHAVPRLSTEERSVAVQLGLTDADYIKHREAMQQRDRDDAERARIARGDCRDDAERVARAFGCSPAEIRAHAKVMQEREQAELDEITRRKATRGALVRQPDGSRSTASFYTPEPDEFDR